MASYNLRVAVDEVVLTFHAADAHGLSINDLKVEELRLVDKGRPPRKVLAFQSLQDLPIRAGILMDKSESMKEDLPGNRAISTKYHISLLASERAESIHIRSGYYADTGVTEDDFILRGELLRERWLVE